MSGKELKNMLFLNEISQEEASKKLGISRQTLNHWCNREKLSEKIFTKVKSVFPECDLQNSIKNLQSIVITGENNTTGNIDNRQYFAESLEVLKAQIQEKDAQISRLLKIIEGLTTSSTNN